MEVFVLAGMSLVGVLVAVSIAANPEKVEKVLSPSEEARFELHPTIGPETTKITTENVNDVVNDSIETGVPHPALVARRNR